MIALQPPERRLLRLAILSAIVATVASILLLALSGWFLTGAAIAGAAGPIVAQGFNYLIPSAAIRLFAILRTAGRYFERLLSHQAALQAMAGTRADLFDRLAAQDSRTGPDLSGGDASARLIGDVEALEDLVIRQPTAPACWTAAVIGVALAFTAGWLSAGVLVLTLALLPLLMAALAARLTRRPAEALAAANGDLRTRYIACAEAHAEIAAWGLADRVSADLSQIAARRDAAAAALHRGEGAVAALLSGITGIAVAGVVAAAQASAPWVALAALAAAAAVEASAGLARDSARRARVAASVERLKLLTDLPAAAPTPPPPPATPWQLGSETLNPGARVAITGRSGSGKTLVLEALAGLRAVAMQATPADPALFALSPQAATTIAGSIADNLRLARPGLDEAALWAALDTACLATRVRTLPDGLNTWLGEGGAPLSGGERKRLSLARALLAGRPWLLLDEPTEGLDAATEAEVVARLAAWMARTDTGLVLVSHRVAPLALAARRIAVEAIAPQV